SSIGDTIVPVVVANDESVSVVRMARRKIGSSIDKIVHRPREKIYYLNSHHPGTRVPGLYHQPLPGLVHLHLVQVRHCSVVKERVGIATPRTITGIRRGLILGRKRKNVVVDRLAHLPEIPWRKLRAQILNQRVGVARNVVGPDYEAVVSVHHVRIGSAPDRVFAPWRASNRRTVDIERPLPRDPEVDWIKRVQGR